MKSWINEFKEFINRGNLIDLAIAVVLATFFAPIVTAIVDGVVLRLIAAIFGQPSFDSITIDVGDTELLVGTVISALVNFVIVAFVCFLIVKAYNHFKAEEEAAPSGPTELELLTEIRDELRARR
jgi:large conductance mechanosensitive channel